MSSSDTPITQLLIQWSEGNASALDELAPLVYEELRRVPARQLRRERADHTLQTTALVHEAYLRLIDQKSTNWKSRAQFFALASRFMRRILVDRARARLALKRGEGQLRISLDQVDGTLERGGEELAASQLELASGDSVSVELLSIDAALTRLEGLDQRQAQIVELRFFGGLSVEETAETLDISAATVKRDWVMAKAWLARELANAPE